MALPGVENVGVPCGSILELSRPSQLPYNKKSKNAQQIKKIGPDHPSLLSTHVGRYIGQTPVTSCAMRLLEQGGGNSILSELVSQATDVESMVMLTTAPHNISRRGGPSGVRKYVTPHVGG